MLVPFEEREIEDLDLLTLLEQQLENCPTLAGATSHYNFRSYFSPARGVLDGDFVHRFSELGDKERQAVASNLKRDPSDLLKLLRSIHSRYM
ncbi:unnamed protein product [Sphagnum balticum]